VPSERCRAAAVSTALLPSTSAVSTPPRKRLQASLEPRAERASEKGPLGATSTTRSSVRRGWSACSGTVPRNSLTFDRSV
jgi:hypothetical protein